MGSRQGRSLDLGGAGSVLDHLTASSPCQETIILPGKEAKLNIKTPQSAASRQDVSLKQGRAAFH